MQLANSCAGTVLLIVVSSPLPGASDPCSAASARVEGLLASLSRLKAGSVTWVLSQHAVTGLSDAARAGLTQRIEREGDDIVLQGVYGIPHAVLTDRELQLETHVERRVAARALNVSEEAVQRRIAPVEPDVRRLSETTNRDGAIIGTTGAGRRCRLWAAAGEGYTSVPAVDLRRTNAERRLPRAEARSRLNRNNLACLLVDARSPEAVRRFDALAPSLTASTVAFPDGQSHAVATLPEDLTPLAAVERTPLWHAQLIALARTRPRTPRGRTTKRALSPFGAAPAELERSIDGSGELYENRVFHASMLGSARMSEGDLTVHFSNGSLIGLTRGEPAHRVAKAYTGVVRDERGRSAFRVAGAFSFDWDTARGLATHAVAGGIATWVDYLLLDGVSWLIVRARIDYRAGNAENHSAARVRPLPLPLGRARGEDAVTADLRRHDGGRETVSAGGSERTRLFPVVGEHVTLHVGSHCTEVLFIDAGQGVTWEAAVEIVPRGPGRDVYLLPFGEFTQIPTTVGETSIVFALRDCDSPSTPAERTELKRRVLSVLPSPATETAAPQPRETTSSPA
jgi:hypothetical protein